MQCQFERLFSTKFAGSSGRIATNFGSMCHSEADHLGGKGSDPHKAAVVGDTVGDPCKDTAGPCMNSMIEVMSAISVIFAPLFLR